MKLTVGKHSIDLSRPVVMTIINATPDSFYEGSRTPRADDVARRAERAVADGAAILDVGGYSSRPGAPDRSASCCAHRAVSRRADVGHSGR